MSTRHLSPKTNSPTQNKTRTWLFALSVLLVYPLPQVAIDIYLPSWPAMTHELHTTCSLVQQSLTIYLLFLGVTQLIYGPLSDRFGRKPILLLGIAIFITSSCACLFVTSISQFLISRAAQGLGMGCGFTIASAILADVFEGNELAKMTSYSAMIYSLSLILAPVAGSYIHHYIGWKANFGVMAIYGLILFILISWFVDETKKPETRVALSFKTTLRNYFAMFTTLPFVGALLCLTLAYGTMIAFNIVGPFLFQETLHISDITYGKLLLIVGLSYFFGATVNSHLINKYGTPALTIFGLILMALSSIGLFVVCSYWLSVFSITVFVSLAIFSLGFIYPNCFAYALGIFPEKGYASALIGSSILIGVSIISTSISRHSSNYGPCLSYAFLTLSLFSLLAYLLTIKTRAK